MNLLSLIKSRKLQSATPTATPATSPDSPNAGPFPIVRAVARMAQVDGASMPVQSRYSGQRPNIKALNRNSRPAARRGSTRSAVGL